MGLANWIIRAATSNPPKGREQWALAMQAEYASLGDGRLGWALGCWTTMLGWRLRADALYLVVMIAVVYYWAFSTFFYQPFFLIYLKLPHAIQASPYIQPFLANMLVTSIVLCAFRPDRAFITSATMIAFGKAAFVAGLYEMQRKFPETHPFSETWNFYNAPPFVAGFAEIGVCFVGALTGRWIASLWRKRPPLADDGRVANDNPAIHQGTGTA